MDENGAASRSQSEDRRETPDLSFPDATRAPSVGTELPGEELRHPEGSIEPPSVPDGTFVKVAPKDHPLARACEVAVYMQDYHRSSSKLGRFGKVVGIDAQGGEYLVMLDNFECLAVPMRRCEWRKVAT